MFEGNAFDAAAGFPANVNVAAALALAGIGPMRTRVQIWADPGVTRNTHTIQVEAEAARFTMTIENVPSEDNPRTGKLTALSVLSLPARPGVDAEGRQLALLTLGSHRRIPSLRAWRNLSLLEGVLVADFRAGRSMLCCMGF